MNRIIKSATGVFVAVLLVLSLAACGTTPGQKDGGTIAISGESLNVNDIALRPEGEASKIYENGGIRLLVPLEYESLLVIDTPENSRDGVLFRVSERASMDAAKAQGDEYDGAGWLFSISRISEDEYHEALCYDMSGREGFARDEADRYYLYNHPTDVRIVRESYDNMEEEMKLWAALNEWAATVPDSLLAENTGLTPERHGNTELDICLARIAYLDGTRYTLGTEEGGPLEPDDVDAGPYLDRLMNGVTFEYADNPDMPDGDFITLRFPDNEMRFDFFLSEGNENSIREVWSDGGETLYRAVFDDDNTKAGDIVRAWYYAVASGDTSDPWDTSERSDFTGEEFVGEWQDEYSQRAVMRITETENAGVYDVRIHWGSSYHSAVQWSMRATAGAQDVILSYEDETKTEIVFPDDGEEQDTVLWENGSGYLMFQDGVLKWYDEQEPDAELCRFVKAE